MDLKEVSVRESWIEEVHPVCLFERGGEGGEGFFQEFSPIFGEGGGGEGFSTGEGPPPPFDRPKVRPPEGASNSGPWVQESPMVL